MITNIHFLKLKEKLYILSKERNSLDDNDPSIYKIWEKITDLLTEDIENTIRILNEDNFEFIGLISEVIEEVYYKTNNNEFLTSLLKWEKKYPQLKLELSIKPLLNENHET